jgi:hypothetical protein
MIFFHDDHNMTRAGHALRNEYWTSAQQQRSRQQKRGGKT